MENESLFCVFRSTQRTVVIESIIELPLIYYTVGVLFLQQLISYTELTFIIDFSLHESKLSRHPDQHQAP